MHVNTGQLNTAQLPVIYIYTIVSYFLGVKLDP